MLRISWSNKIIPLWSSRWSWLLQIFPQILQDFALFVEFSKPCTDKCCFRVSLLLKESPQVRQKCFLSLLWISWCLEKLDCFLVTYEQWGHLWIFVPFNNKNMSLCLENLKIKIKTFTKKWHRPKIVPLIENAQF